MRPEAACPGAAPRKPPPRWESPGPSAGFVPSHAPARVHPFGNLRPGQNRFERFAPARKAVTDAAIAAVRANAGRDQVADAGQSGERRRLGPERHAEARVYLHEPAG